MHYLVPTIAHVRSGNALPVGLLNKHDRGMWRRKRVSGKTDAARHNLKTPQLTIRDFYV